MPYENETPPGQAAGLGNKSLLGGFDGSENSPTLSPKQIKSYKRRAIRRYATMLRLHDHGIQADVIPLARRPDPDRVVSQILGIDLIFDAANAGDDFAWLQDRDILLVRDKASLEVDDDPNDTLVLIPLKIAAEIVLAAQDISEKLDRMTAINISCGLIRPERRRLARRERQS